jgi:hypothetical protein
LSDSANAKLVKELQPFIKELTDLWESKTERDKALRYAELTELSNQLSTAERNVRPFVQILEEKEIYLDKPLPQTGN